MTGVERIAAERQRQTDVEGWTAEHDAEHSSEELAWAAVCYAAPAPVRAEVRVSCGCRSIAECPHILPPTRWLDPWPWNESWDKRKTHDRIRRLEIAGALIAAEIDRLTR